MIASVVERATARAVCLALATALARFGVPEEILTDNSERFTPGPEERRELLPALLPPTLAAAPTWAAADVTGAEEDEEASPTEVPRPGRAGWVVRSSWTG